MKAKSAFDQENGRQAAMLTIQDTIPAKNEYAIRSSPSYYTKPRIYHKGLAETLARVLGLRDPALVAHSLGVANFATKIARRLGLPEEQVDLIRRGSLLHDVGKLGVSQDILSKPAPLAANQYEMVKTHPARGAVLLQECLEYHALIPIVRHHHEFYNGQGYPDKIAGNEIEIEARIVAVADAVDAMSSDRPYRKAFTVRQVIDELERCSNSQFDPIVVEAAINILMEKETGNTD